MNTMFSAFLTVSCSMSIITPSTIVARNYATYNCLYVNASLHKPILVVSDAMVACTTWPARVKQPCSGFESHRSHIKATIFPFLYLSYY
jgi:hypothetical protein